MTIPATAVSTHRWKLRPWFSGAIFPALTSAFGPVSGTWTKMTPWRQPGTLDTGENEAHTMSIEFQDVLKTNLVLLGVNLLNEQHQRDAFVSMAGTEVDVEPILQGPVLPLPIVGNPSGPETGLSLNLRRDRIRIDSLPSRTSIEQEYPRREDLERLTEVMNHAIELTGLENQVLTAFGFNMERVYRHKGEEPSEMYLANRLFSHQQGSLEGLTLAGGACKLGFIGDGAKWNFTLEPRANDPTNRKVFLSLNLHRDKPQAPSWEEIRDSLQQVWDRSEELATWLDGGT